MNVTDVEMWLCSNAEDELCKVSTSVTLECYCTEDELCKVSTSVTLECYCTEDELCKVSTSVTLECYCTEDELCKVSTSVTLECYCTEDELPAHVVHNHQHRWLIGDTWTCPYPVLLMRSSIHQQAFLPTQQ